MSGLSPYCSGQGLSDFSPARFAGILSPNERGGNGVIIYGQYNKSFSPNECFGSDVQTAMSRFRVAVTANGLKI